jgi:hypothetical protein
VIAYRLRAGHIGERLPAGALREAAWAGLQDTAPRSAVLSLHARVGDVTPSGWEHPDLVQVWGPRAAAYVVPRSDVALFTIGRLPRDEGLQRLLQELTDRVHAVLAGRTLPSREVGRALGDRAVTIRGCAITGRIHIRWDARDCEVIPVDAPDVDSEEARIGLARRFLNWFAPATWKRFSWWAGIEDRDAKVTWARLERELVQVAGQDGFALDADADALRSAPGVEGARLLPADDPFLKTDRELLVPDGTRRPELFPPIGSSRGFIPGAVLVDGEICGVWQRQGRRVRIEQWHPFGAPTRDLVCQEASAFPIDPLGQQVRIEWDS